MLDQIKEDLVTLYKHRVDRLNHIYGVKNIALKLGKIYGADLDKIRIVALLHDYTKYESPDFHEALIRKHYSEKIIQEYSKPLYHGFSAAVMAKEKYRITDEDIIKAIESHTVGRPNMSLLEKIIFISDYIEPNRMYPSCVKAREIAFNNIDLAIYEAINDSITLYEHNGGFIPKIAYEARKYYKEKGGLHGKN